MKLLHSSLAVAKAVCVLEGYAWAYLVKVVSYYYNIFYVTLTGFYLIFLIFDISLT